MYLFCHKNCYICNCSIKQLHNRIHSWLKKRQVWKKYLTKQTIINMCKVKLYKWKKRKKCLNTQNCQLLLKKKKKGGEREKIDGKYGIRYNIFTLYNKHGLPKKNWKERKITAQLKKKRSREHLMLNQSFTTTTTLTIYVACLWLVLYRPTVYRIGCWGVTQTLQEIQHKTNSDTQVSVTTSPSNIFRTTPPPLSKNLHKNKTKILSEHFHQ